MRKTWNTLFLLQKSLKFKIRSECFLAHVSVHLTVEMINAREMSHNRTNLVNACKLSINNRSWLSNLNFINFNTFNVRSYNSASNYSFLICFFLYFTFYILNFTISSKEKNLTIYRSRATNFNNLNKTHFCVAYEVQTLNVLFFFFFKKKKLKVPDLTPTLWRPSIIIKYGAHVIPIGELSIE